MANPFADIVEERPKSNNPFSDIVEEKPQGTISKTPGEKSVGEFLFSKVPSSAWKVTSGMAKAITSPFQTASGIGEVVGKVGNVALSRMFGVPPNPEAEATTRAITEPITRSIEDPLGVPGRLYDWAYENPVEAGLMVSGGAQLAGAKTLAKYANPYYLPMKGVEKIIEKATKTLPLEKVVEEGMKKGTGYYLKGKRTETQVSKYLDNATDAVETIIKSKDNLSLADSAGNIIKGKLPETVEEFRQAVSQTKQFIYSKYHELTTKTGETGVTVQPKKLVSELMEIANAPELRDVRPGIAKYAENMANRISNRIKDGGYTPEQTENMIAQLNRDLKAYYASPDYKNATRAHIDAVIKNNMSKELDNTISSITGKEYQELKNQYGGLRAIEEDVGRKAIVEGRKHVKGLIDFSDLYSGAEAVRGILRLDPSAIAASAATKGLARYYKYLNSPNTAVRNMFSKGEKLILGESPSYFDPIEIARRRGMPRGIPMEQVTPYETPLLTGPPPLKNAPTVIPIPSGRELVPTGERFGVESIRHPQLEWWRGMGAKGVRAVPSGPELQTLALPKGTGFTVIPRTGEGYGYPTIPEGKGKAEYLSRHREKWYPKQPMSGEELATEVALAKDAIFKGVPLNKVKEFFKARTGREFPQ